MHRRPFLLINNMSVEVRTRWGEVEGRGHADDAVSLLITVVCGRRRPLSRPNYRRRSGNCRLHSSALSASSAFFIMTLPALIIVDSLTGLHVHQENRDKDIPSECWNFCSVNESSMEFLRSS